MLRYLNQHLDILNLFIIVNNLHQLLVAFNVIFISQDECGVVTMNQKTIDHIVVPYLNTDAIFFGHTVKDQLFIFVIVLELVFIIF